LAAAKLARSKARKENSSIESCESNEVKYWEMGCISPSHIDARARRYMAKVFVADLWREWRARDGRAITKKSALTQFVAPFEDSILHRE
jgi:hypothetical protein